MHQLCLLSLCFSLHACGTVHERVIRLSPAVTSAGTDLGGEGVTHITPVYLDGQRYGVRIGEVAPQSLAAELALVSGDVLVAMAEVECTSVPRCRQGLRRLSDALRRRRNFTLGIVRRGTRLRFLYRFPSVQPVSLPAG